MEIRKQARANKKKKKECSLSWGHRCRYYCRGYRGWSTAERKPAGSSSTTYSITRDAMATWAYLLLYILTHLASSSCRVWTTMLALHFLNRFLFFFLPTSKDKAIYNVWGPRATAKAAASSSLSFSLLFFAKQKRCLMVNSVRSYSTFHDRCPMGE